jgi:hypothetical protein
MLVASSVTCSHDEPRSVLQMACHYTYLVLSGCCLRAGPLRIGTRACQPASPAIATGQPGSGPEPASNKCKPASPQHQASRFWRDVSMSPLSRIRGLPTSSVVTSVLQGAEPMSRTHSCTASAHTSTMQPTHVLSSFTVQEDSKQQTMQLAAARRSPLDCKITTLLLYASCLQQLPRSYMCYWSRHAGGQTTAQTSRLWASMHDLRTSQGAKVQSCTTHAHLKACNGDCKPLRDNTSNTAAALAGRCSFSQSPVQHLLCTVL